MSPNDYSASDSLRIAAKILPADDPNNPRNPEFLAAAAQAEREAEAIHAVEAAPVANAPAAQSEADTNPQPTAAPKKRRKRRSRRPGPRQPKIAVEESRLDRHKRMCTICNHEDREEIEQEFLDWIHPDGIAEQYEIDWRAVYRHAHATGLFPARQRNLRAALGHIVEKAAWVEPTVDGLLRAMRAFSSLDREGRWSEIPTHVVVSSGAQLAQSNLIGESLKTLTLRTVSNSSAAANPSPAGAAGDASEPPEHKVLLDNDSE